MFVGPESSVSILRYSGRIPSPLCSCCRWPGGGYQLLTYNCVHFVEALAKEISDYFADADKLVVVGLLRGSFVFIADLVRELNMPVEVDFLEVSSYGDAMESSREARIMKDIRGEVEGLHVLATAVLDHRLGNISPTTIQGAEKLLRRILPDVEVDHALHTPGAQ